MVVPVPVRPVNKTRPFSRGALILKAITPLRENRVWPRETSGEADYTDGYRDKNEEYSGRWYQSSLQNDSIKNTTFN